MESKRSVGINYEQASKEAQQWNDRLSLSAGQVICSLYNFSGQMTLQQVYDRVCENASKQEFVKQVSELDAGMLSQIAKNALKDNRIDECIQMWLDQDADPGSRKKVQEVLGEELYNILQSFKSNRDEE